MIRYFHYSDFIIDGMIHTCNVTLRFVPRFMAFIELFVHKYMGCVMNSHIKAQTFDGLPVVELPPMNERTVMVQFTPAQECFI